MGTIINLTVSDEEGTWFRFFFSKMDPETHDITYEEPIPDGPRMRLRNPADFFAERAKGRKTEKEFVLNKKSKAMEKVVSQVPLTPEEKQAESEDLFDYVITAIEGFNIEGRPMKCTREDKMKALKIPMVSLFVNRCIVLMQEGAAVQEEAESKNSSTGSGSKKIKSAPGSSSKAGGS